MHPCSRAYGCSVAFSGRDAAAGLVVYLLCCDVSCCSSIFTWQTYNALYVIRNLCKYFVENLTEDVVVEQFRAVVVNGNVVDVKSGSL